MNFMRPSVRKLLTHWIEVIIVFLGALLFGYLALVSIGRILPLVYGAITIALFFLMLVAIRRVRLSSEVDIKSGFVEVDERQITYFSLGQSWSISLDDLVLVEAEVVVKESIYFYWVISDIYGSVIRIPASVKGNENLLDAISSLEGVLFDQISNSMNIDSPGRKIIWQKKF
ncbi:hypothetical protein N8Y37_04915 [Amylibacter sp.]|jgi:hypothetical protein|nr:hypothetical protein [Amylibacter sp.]MDA9287408.1 hypothetical protein [Amylibacter sp.]MDA9369256.1 hypothetical protein [Amylibacter sp.]MDA9780117.1 hypothetical protein [Amylibacter sp.]MDB0000865.1 hypothetical protein [Amylibacter sp.]|tara:strand:+ start:1899 stop:2414 length:516 start_codon:yes stop_codon:yes gene_type:complete